ncbi:ABC transporter permease [Corynebacterium sp. TAE3-ERU12]|uniref:ABC transporter permease n=1 Tax=Corynebacterium sp. TAE3-ERU12 TaxID=2849491 RepID=UPI001C442554|nr:ABC transporter permease [Corynebacterium sp. TAE3-ERU12]MBV7295558.1 ABC transporter permease [Corynebacterium sp. TAE3-ERU12]
MKNKYTASSAIGSVAARELRSTLLRKGTLVTLVLSIVAIVGGIIFTAYQQDKDSAGVETTPIAVVGNAPFAEQLPDVELTPAEDEETARELLADGDVDGALFRDGAQWTLVDDDISSTTVEQLQASLTAAGQAKEITAQGGDPAKVFAAGAAQQLNIEHTEQLDIAKLLTVGISLMVMLFAVLMFGGYVAQSVIEEKSSRVVEILLSTVKPLHLLTGKILGAGAAGLVMVLSIGAAGVITAFATGLTDGFTVPWTTMGLMVLYFILGYLFFSLLYATGGSLVSRMEDFGGVQTPILLLVFAVIYAPSLGWSSLDTPLMKVLGWLPPTSISTAPLQYAMGNMSLGEVLAAAFILAITCALVLLLAVKIYPRNVLRTGKSSGWIAALKG